MPLEKKKLKALPAPETKKKKSLEALDVSAKKKKKKRTEIVEYEEEPKRLSKTRTKTLLKTQFGTGAEKILRMLEQDETDPALALLHKRLLSAVVDVLPLAEMGIRASKGTRGIHGFTMLTSQIRELIVDIQATQDRGMMGETLVQQVIQPAFGDLAQDTVQEFSVIAADAKANMTEEEYKLFAPLLRDARARLANRMTHHYNQMKSGTIDFLQR